MGKIIIKVGIVSIVILILSVVVDYMYRQVYHLNYQWPKNIWLLPPIKNKYDLVILGSSHAQEGITFDRIHINELSLAGVGQPLQYDLANLKMYSQQINEGAVIIISISPISFSQAQAKPEDSLQTQYYDGRLSPFLIPNIKWEDYIQSQIIPFVRSGYLWRNAIDTKIKARIASEEKWPEPSPTPTPFPVRVGGYLPISAMDNTDLYQVNTIRHELAAIPPTPKGMLEDSMNFMFNKWYRTTDFDTKYFSVNRKDLQAIIDYCIKMKWRPVMITIPISRVLLSGLLPDYMQTYVYDNVAKINPRGAPYFNFMTDTRLTDNPYLFGNSDHFNHKGAIIFSYLLVRKLIDTGYLPASADAYEY